MSRQAIRVFLYLKSMYELYRVHGGKLLTFDEVMERHNICLSCPHLDGKVCKLCGCDCTKSNSDYFNKLAFPNESCPDNPPRWKSK